MDYSDPRSKRIKSFANLPRLHELWRGRRRHHADATEADSQPFFRQALEAGINFFDTANVYLREARKKSRDGRFAASLAETRSSLPPRPSDPGAGRQIPGPLPEGPLPGNGRQPSAPWHGLRGPLSDPPLRFGNAGGRDHGGTPRPGEGRENPLPRRLLLAALAVRQNAAGGRAPGWTRFIAMQPQVNLIYREEEREMLPLCQDQGVG